MGESRAPIVRPEVVFVEDLLEEIARGKLRLPRFQRPFVWKPSDMLSLFDSIFKGYPIGSLLLWESAEEAQSLDEVGPIKVPCPSEKPLAYILDGHQRLATLFGGLRLPESAPRGADQENWRWWIWFDLEKEEFLHVPKGAPDQHLLPLRAVLRTIDFLEESRRIQQQFPGDKGREYIEHAEQLAQKFKNYKVAVTRITGGALREAVEIFSRLNTKGRSMTLDQMVSALTYREEQGGMNLAECIDDILGDLSGYHFGSVRRPTVFFAIVAAAEKDIYKSDWEKIAKGLGEDLPSAVKAAHDSLLASARFLYEEIEVPGDELLPYSLQMLMLSEFFRCRKRPSRRHKELLRKWFWVTSLSGWFAGANSTKIRNAIEEMRRLAEDDQARMEVMPLDEPARPFPKSFDMRSARIRALLLMMLRSQPRDLESGQPLNPAGILREQGNRALVHVFDRRAGELVSHPANRVFVERSPGKSVRDRLRDIQAQYLDEVLSSHCIPREAYDALRRSDAKGFIESRARHLMAIEKDFMADLGITPPSSDSQVEADIDADDE